MGTNTLSIAGVTTAAEIEASEISQYYTALEGDLVPRSSGVPTANSGSVGTNTYPYSDLFLASGAVINFNAGNTTITHSASVLTVSGAKIVINHGTTAEMELTTTAGNNGSTLQLSDFVGRIMLLKSPNNVGAGDGEIGTSTNHRWVLMAGGNTAAAIKTENNEGQFALVDGITEPSTEVGFAFLYVDTADGDLKVKFGDGTVKTIVVDT